MLRISIPVCTTSVLSVCKRWIDLWDHQVAVWAMDCHILESLRHWKMDQHGWFTKVSHIIKVHSCMPPFQSAWFHLHFKLVILIHAGKDYSEGSSGCQAVVTDDWCMSSAWREVDRATCHQRHRLGTYVQKAGCQYKLFSDNCWIAARRMMNLCRSWPSSGWCMVRLLKLWQ